MRRYWSLVVSLALIVAALISASAFPRPSAAGQWRSAVQTYRLGWSVPVHVKSRPALRVHVYWLRVSSSGWAVRGSVVNRSGHVLRPITVGKTGWGWEAVTTSQKARPVQCNWSRCRDAQAASFIPALPHTLRPGAHWSGVFRGPGYLPRRWWISFDLGYYDGWPRDGFGFGPTRQALYIR